MGLEARQIKAIDLILSGEYTITKVAELVGVSRGTIYNWMEKEEFKVELDKRTQQIRDMAHKEFDGKLMRAIDLYWELATTSTDNRTKELALRTWIERALGKTTTKVDISDSRATSAVSDSDILSAIDAARVEEDREELIN